MSKTYFLKDTALSGFGSLSLTDPGASTMSTGWTVAKVTSANFSALLYATKRASNTFSTTNYLVTTHPNPGSGDSWRSENPITGTFANANWVLAFKIRAASAASSQAGRVNVRIWKSVNASGASATELTSVTQVGTTTAALSTTVDATSTVTWAPGGTLTFTNEYLFVQCEWEITTASGSTTGDAVFRASASTVVTSAFSQSVVAGAGSYALTGTAATLEHGWRVTASAGSYALTGSTASLVHSRKVAAGAGAYSLTGTAVTLRHAWVDAAVTGSYSLTGATVSLTHSLKIAAGIGVYSLTGAVTALLHKWDLAAINGTYILNGSNVTFSILNNFVLPIDIGAYVLAGTAVTLSHLRKVIAASGIYLATGSPVSLIVARKLAANSGQYTLTGIAASLIASGTGPSADCSFSSYARRQGRR